MSLTTVLNTYIHDTILATIFIAEHVIDVEYSSQRHLIIPP
jgi:hypothetical protein